MRMNRVVITGVGSVSPFGRGAGALLDGLQAGRSAVVDMREEWEPLLAGLTCLVGAPLSEPLDEKSIPRKSRRSMGPAAMMACVAGRDAVDDAGLGDEALRSGRTGICFASTMGSTSRMSNAFREFLQGDFHKGLSSGTFFQIMSHTCAANLAQYLGVCGRVVSPDAACASATLAIGLGFETIRAGTQDIMLCGGAEELHAIVAGCFDLVQASSCHFNDRPSATPRPFDRDRDGTVCGEGAGALVLESESSARARGARILGEVAGFASLADGTHVAQPQRESIARCLDNALDNAGFLPDAIDYINAHGTGTRLGDAAEAQAIVDIFGRGKTPVSSLKGHLGHTLGASGALELIAALRMMHEGQLVPTLNLDQVAEECAGIDHVTAPRETAVHAFLKSSFAFGGINSVLAVKRYENA